MNQVELPPIPKVSIDGKEPRKAATEIGETSPAADSAAHGARTEKAEEDISHFYRRVDSVVARLLADEQVPLILACVDYLAPIYRMANSYRFLEQTNVSGSPNRMRLKDIHQQACAIMDARDQVDLERSFARLREEVGVGRGSTDVRDVVLAADDGRIDTLFVSRRAHLWGRVDGRSRLVEVSDNEMGDDLIDFAAARTLSCRGVVRAVEKIPSINSPVAAIFRY